MNILVTGGAGFIGSHLVKALDKEGHAVFVVDNLSSGKRENLPAHIPLIEADIRDMGSLANLPESIDAVFHLAAQMDVRHSVADPVFDSSVNVLGTVAVLNYAAQAGAKRVVFSSSGGAIYGAAEEVPTSEKTLVASSSPYGIAKYSGEQYVYLFSRLHGIHPVVLRYANVYGPGQSGSRESGVIAIFCDRAMSGQPLTIYGDGEQTRDFVHVEDVVRANLAALETEHAETFNIGTSNEITINQLAQSLKEIVPHDLEICYAPAKEGEERRSCLNVEKAKVLLKWEPKIDLKKGLSTTLASVKSEQK